MTFSPPGSMAIRQLVPERLTELKKSELTQEGKDIMRVRSGDKGKYLIFKPGAVEFRVEIEALREQWKHDVKKTKKPSLIAEDGF